MVEMSHRAEQIALLAQRWPEVAVVVAEAAAPREVVRVEDGVQPTLRIDGIQLCSAWEPEAEARWQAQQVPADARRVRVYDVGQGHVIAELLRRTSIEALEVVLLAPAAFRASLAVADHLGWMRDPRVILRCARPDDRPEAPFVVCPAGLRLAESAAFPLRDRLVLTLSAPYQAAHARRYDLEFREALAQEGAIASGDAVDWFDSRPGGRAVVAAAGPSLGTQLEWLKKHRSEVTLVAVNSAARPLFAAGIVPDFVVAVDGLPILERHLTLDEPHRAIAEHVPLIHAVGVAQGALRAWPGPRFATRLSAARFDVLQVPRARLWCSGTVTHAACDFAVRLGARELVLLGADFGFPGGNSHVAGAPEERGIDELGRRFTVADGYGGQILTNVTFLGYARDLDDWLAANPEVRAWKRGRAGAALSHAAWMHDDV
jgi:hypothetical protein